MTSLKHLICGAKATGRCLLVLTWICGFNVAQAVQILDDRGQVVTFAQAPQRIVSLLPSLTESVCSLGQCHRLVGVDRYSNYPAQVQALPKVGGGLDPSIESVAALKPDLILASGTSRAVERLEALGFKVLSLETKTHADVRRVLQVLHSLLNAPGAQSAEQLWRDMDAAVTAAAQSVPGAARNISVFFEVSGGQYGAGENSFIGETLARLGAKNVVPASLGPFPKLSPEFIVRSNPDVIMTSSASMSAMSVFAGWSSLKAVKAKRICVFNSEDSDVLVRPGPRLAEAAWLMASCLRSKAR